MIKRILLIVLFCMYTSLVIAKSGINIFAYSRPAPQTPIYTAEGKALRLEELKGNFVLVMFWSRYCAPCIKELDEINTFVKKTKDNGVQVLLVSNSEEWTEAWEQRQLLQKYRAEDIEYYIDKKGKLAGDFGVFSYPHTVLINKAGEEIGRISGTVEWDEDDVVEYIYKLKAQQG